MFNRFFGYQNTYLKILAETGIFSLLFFLIFLLRKWVTLLTIEDKALLRCLHLSFLACVMHWYIADCFYHPSFWISLSCIGIFNGKEK
jgi:O-antigen ligase